jgi:hypothetical protein
MKSDVKLQFWEFNDKSTIYILLVDFISIKITKKEALSFIKRSGLKINCKSYHNNMAWCTEYDKIKIPDGKPGMPHQQKK